MREKRECIKCYFLRNLKMVKAKPIMPSLREKKRYMAFEVISKSHVASDKVFEAIKGSALAFMGEQGYGKAGIMILKNRWDAKHQKGIIRVGHRYTDNLRASLALIKKMNDNEVIVRSLGLSGILRKAINKYLAA